LKAGDSKSIEINTGFWESSSQLAREPQRNYYESIRERKRCCWVEWELNKYIFEDISNQENRSVLNKRLTFTNKEKKRRNNVFEHEAISSATRLFQKGRRIGSGEI